MTKEVTGTTIRAAYLTEYWNTFFSVSRSFVWSNFEKAGKSIVVTGVAKNVINTTKFTETE